MTGYYTFLTGNPIGSVIKLQRKWMEMSPEERSQWEDKADEMTHKKGIFTSDQLDQLKKTTDRTERDKLRKKFVQMSKDPEEKRRAASERSE